MPYGCWRKATLEKIGLFDESLVRNQDDELNLRLTRSGGRIWQSRSILSWYSPRQTFSALFHQFLQYGFWKVAVIRKHRIPGSSRHLVPAAFVLINAILLVAMPVAFVTHSSWLAAFIAAWLLLAVTYGIATVCASAAAARKNGWDTFPLLPLAFAIYHLSYGIGFIAGLCRFHLGSKLVLTSDSIFARLSR